MLIVNGLVALPGSESPVRADVRVEGERITEIAPNLAVLPGEDMVDATGLIVLPGAIDPHVHFDTPGFTQREDFLHGSSEAARGGVTTVVDMPCTSLPPVVSPENLEIKLAAVAPLAVVDYGFYGGLHGLVSMTGGTARPQYLGLESAMEALAPRVLGFKCYLLSGMETFPRVNHQELGRAIAKADALGRPLLLHAEDADYVSAAQKAMKDARGSGVPTWDDYVDSRPEAAERVACSAAVALAFGHEGSLHVVHVGTSEAAETVAAAGASCETCAHYLAFSREDFASKGSSLKTAPPVKARGQADRLWKLLADGTIAFVTSDHAPAMAEEKRSGSVWTDYGGIPGTGTMLPYLFSEGYLTGRLGLARFLEVISSAAAQRYGLWARKGSIEVGKDADLVLIDPKATSILSGENLYSKGHDTPFEGMKLNGSIRSTWLRGQKIYDADIGISIKPGYGRFLTWGYA